MRVNDDTIEQIKKKNTLLRKHLSELINDEDNTETNILRQVIPPARQINRRSNSPIDKVEPISEMKTHKTDEIDRSDKYKAYLGPSGDDTSKFKRSHLTYFNKLKENIDQIKSTDYQLPAKIADSKVQDKLKEIQLNDQDDRLEMKKNENLLLNKLYKKDEMVSTLQDQVRSLQEENQRLNDYGNEYKRQLQYEREQNMQRHKHELNSKQTSTNEELASLKVKLHEMAQQNSQLERQNQTKDAELAKCQAAVKDLTIKLIMYKKANNSSQDKMERLRLINGYLNSVILKDTSSNDDTESLIDSTTIRLISHPQRENYLTQNTNFSACDAKTKLKVLIKAVLFMVRMQNLHKDEINFKNKMAQLLDLL